MLAVSAPTGLGAKVVRPGKAQEARGKIMARIAILRMGRV
jgi:hypothetical protein